MSGVVNVWGGERLRWWMSGVVNVWFYTGGGERLRWWTSGVVNVWFYTGGGERLGMVNVWVVNVLQSLSCDKLESKVLQGIWDLVKSPAAETSFMADGKMLATTQQMPQKLVSSGNLHFSVCLLMQNKVTSFCPQR